MFKILDWKSIHSMSNKMPEYLGECEALEQWCQEIQDEVERELVSIEIGSFHGRTTVLLAQFGTVLAIDLFGHVEDGFAQPDKIGEHSLKPFLDNIKAFELIDKVYPIVASSRFLNELPYLHADVALVDGSHLYREVIKDLQRVERHVLPKGIIVLHDYKRPGYAYPPYDKSKKVDPWKGVAKAVDEFAENNGWQIKHKHAGMVALERVR